MKVSLQSVRAHAVDRRKEPFVISTEPALRPNLRLSFLQFACIKSRFRMTGRQMLGRLCNFAHLPSRLVCARIFPSSFRRLAVVVHFTSDETSLLSTCGDRASHARYDSSDGNHV